MSDTTQAREREDDEAINPALLAALDYTRSLAMAGKLTAHEHRALDRMIVSARQEATLRSPSLDREAVTLIVERAMRDARRVELDGDYAAFAGISAVAVEALLRALAGQEAASGCTDPWHVNSRAVPLSCPSCGDTLVGQEAAPRDTLEERNPADCTCEHVHASSPTCRSLARSRGAVPESSRVYPTPLDSAPPSVTEYERNLDRALAPLKRAAENYDARHAPPPVKGEEVRDG